MNYRPLMTLMLCFSSIFMAEATAESVYKWIDAQGNIHYGDRPQNDSAQTLRVAPPPPVDTASQQRLDALKKPGKDNQKKKEEAVKEAANPNSNKEVAKRNCAAAKENLVQLETASTFLVEKDTEGNPRIIPPEERTKKAEAMQKEVERWCNWT